MPKLDRSMADAYTDLLTGDNSTTQLLDLNDPMLDMDPFGFSASIQFPSSFSFDTSSMELPKTISPKDVDLEYHESEEDANIPVFPCQ